MFLHIMVNTINAARPVFSCEDHRFFCTHWTSLMVRSISQSHWPSRPCPPITLWKLMGGKTWLKKIFFVCKSPHSGGQLEFQHVLGTARRFSEGLLVEQGWVPAAGPSSPCPPYLTVDLGGASGVSSAPDTAGTFSFIVVHVLSEVFESSCIF